MNTAPVAPPVERSPLDAPAPPAGDEPHEAWFSRLARLSARRRGRVMLLWLAITLVAAPVALTLNSAMSGAGWEAQLDHDEARVAERE